MPGCYDVTGGKNNARYIDPSDIEDNKYIQALVRKANPRSLERVFKTAEEAVDSIVQHGAGKLIWTKTGALFGHNSLQPKKHVDHLWKIVIDAVGDGKECLITVGCILRLTIAKRQTETWLSWIELTDEIDPDTGKPIKVTQYWVDNSFAPPPAQTIKTSLDELRSKWGCR